MKQEELHKILENHKHWLFEGVEGWDNLRANLRGADLRDADLRDADLRDADLKGADLRRADLRGADLRDADLRDADLKGADLSRADLRGADLRDADLRDADLKGADLRDAVLKGADLRGVKNLVLSFACPDSGSFVAWKKCVTPAGHYCIVKLRIPDDARRSSATTNKCRANKAIVLGIETMHGDLYPDDFQAQSIFCQKFTYKKGELLEVEDFDVDRWNECSTGIHFFINRIDAFNY